MIIGMSHRIAQALASSNTIDTLPSVGPIQPRLSRIISAKLHSPDQRQLAVTLTASEARQIYSALAAWEAGA